MEFSLVLRHSCVAVLGWAFSSEGEFDSAFVVKADVLIDSVGKLFGRLPGFSVVHFNFASTEEPFAGRIIWAATLFGHETCDVVLGC